MGESSPTTTTLPSPGSARYSVLDFARLAAVFMMIQGHAIGTFVIPSEIPPYEGFWGTIYTWLRGLTSPTFLLISGMVNFVGLRRDEAGRVLPRVLRKRIRRALMLILIDYMLVFPSGRVWGLAVLTPDEWGRFLHVGTLNIIGVSLLVVVLFMRITRSDRSFAILCLGTGITIAGVTPWVHNVDWFAHIPAFFAHYLTYKGGSFFSIFPHTGFMLVGAGMGGYVLHLLRDPNRWKFTIRMVELGFALVMVMLGVELFAPVLLPKHDFFISSPFIFGEKIGLSFMLISLYSVFFHLTRRWAPAYSLLSKKTIHIYVAHILFIFGNTWVWGFGRAFAGSLHIWQGVLMAAAAIVFSFTVGIVTARAERDNPALHGTLRFGFACTLTYFLLFGV